MMNQNKVKKVEKKVYSLVVELADISFLSMQCAESLEEAFVLAKLEFEQQNLVQKDIPFNAKIGLFVVKTVNELINAPDLQDIIDTKQQTEKKVSDAFKILNAQSKTELFETNSKKTKKTEINKKDSSKNILMKLIIDTKDEITFEKNKSLFTVAERKYLKKQLK